MPRYQYTHVHGQKAVFDHPRQLAVGDKVYVDGCCFAIAELVSAGNYRTKRGSSIVLLEDVLAPAPVQHVAANAYPDGNPKSLQGAKKFSLRYFPLPANIAVNQALEDGAKKYGPANWREKGVATSVYIDAALRHISQYYDGKQDKAEDSGVHNLGHAMACLAIIIDAEANGTLTDDRPYPCAGTDALLKRS